MTAELTFIGTATTLLRLGSFTVLTDPNFLHRGQRAYLGYGLWTKRSSEPAMSVQELPSALDAVLLSHLHGDHFDRVARRELDRSLPVLTTPEAERRLTRWGFGSAVGLPVWHSYEMTRADEVLRVTSVPGRHGPPALDRMLPDVMGTLLDLERDGQRQLRIYVTGDTLMRPELSEIPRRFPEIDAMVIHLGGTRIAGLLLTMDARQGADLVDLVGPALSVPVHYDDYPVFRSPLRHFVDEVARRALPGQVRTVRRGESVSLLPPT